MVRSGCDDEIDVGRDEVEDEDAEDDEDQDQLDDDCDREESADDDGVRIGIRWTS